MSILEAIVLGLFQGLTEFLPVSSTAHLRIVPAILGWSDPGASFTAVTQFGTMVAVLVYFRSTILRYTRAVISGLLNGKPFADHDARLAWWMVVGTLPIIACGLLFKDLIETSFRSLYVIAGSLIAVSAALVAAEKLSSFTRDSASTGFTDAIVIGFAQALALVPGVSRSGATITAGMFRQFNRASAAEFSFLLSIPAVALSGLYQLYKLRDALGSAFGVNLLIAVVVSGVVGYASIGLLLKYLRSHSTYLFVVYRLVLGVAIFALLWTGTLQP
jgi:undecaprenyl-diphosphatase